MKRSRYIPDGRTLITLLGLVLALLQQDLPGARWLAGIIAAATVLGVHINGLTPAPPPPGPAPSPADVTALMPSVRQLYDELSAELAAERMAPSSATAANSSSGPGSP